MTFFNSCNDLGRLCSHWTTTLIAVELPQSANKRAGKPRGHPDVTLDKADRYRPWLRLHSTSRSRNRVNRIRTQPGYIFDPVFIRKEIGPRWFVCRYEWIICRHDISVLVLLSTIHVSSSLCRSKSCYSRGARETFLYVYRMHYVQRQYGIVFVNIPGWQTR